MKKLSSNSIDFCSSDWISVVDLTKLNIKIMADLSEQISSSLLKGKNNNKYFWSEQALDTAKIKIQVEDLGQEKLVLKN